MTRASLLGACAALCVGCSQAPTPAAQADAPNDIASVNGTKISAKEYVDYLKRKSVVQVQTGNGNQEARVVGTLGMQALRDLVNRKLLLQLAEKEGVLPSDKDVDGELEFKTKLRPDFVTFLTDQGLSMDMIRDDLKFDLAKERLQTKGITVSAADTDAYIKKHREQFTEPAQAQVFYVLVTSDKAKAAVDAKLKTTEFPKVAGEFSEAPGAKEYQGAYPVTEIQAMPAKLQGLVNQTPAGKATSWQADGKSWVKFFVRAKQPAKPMQVSETQKEYVRRELAMDKGQREGALGKKLNELLTQSQIDVTDAYLKEPWGRAYSQAKSYLTQPQAKP